MRTYIKSLNIGDNFTIPTRDGHRSVYRCEGVRSEAGKTFVLYSVEGERGAWSFVQPSMTTVEVL